MANTLACLCLYHWSTFWTYLVTVSLFSLYLMNFMFNITLDAVGNSLRLHCKSMKCDVSLSQGSVRWGEHVSCMWKIVLPVYSSAKVILKNQTSFSRVIITNVLPLFYESQCILVTTFCVSVCLHGPGCKWGMVRGDLYSCALLCGFAIGGRVSLQ